MSDEVLELSHFSGSEDSGGTVGHLIPNHSDAKGRAGMQSQILQAAKSRRGPPFLLNCTALSVSPLNLNVLVAPNNDVSSYQGWGET